MMTMDEACLKLEPIIQSGFLITDHELYKKYNMVESFLGEYLDDDKDLIPLKILEDDVEAAINILVEYFEKLYVNQKIKSPWCPNCGDTYITATPELYNNCESCGHLLKKC